MKLNILALTATALFAVPAFADEQLMHVSKSAGFAPPDHTYHVECEIGEESTYVKGRKGQKPEQHNSAPTKYTAKVADADAALEIIKKAAKGKIVETLAPTDGPSYKYIGIIEGPVVESHVKLSFTSGNFSKNNAKGVDALVEFADANCAIPE